jgi:hypothetical protein
VKKKLKAKRTGKLIIGPGGFQYDPAQRDPRHPHHQVRARTLMDVRNELGKVTMSIDLAKLEASVEELDAIGRVLQGVTFVLLAIEQHRESTLSRKK